MTAKFIDTTYCYVDNATQNQNWGETYDSSNPDTYEDADCKSECLYHDLFRLCNKITEKREHPKFHFKWSGECNIRETSQNLFDGEGTKYTSDFIGVNRTLAYMAGISDAEIVKYLKKQRTLGGHMLFPVGQYPTINQAKGCNMLDRFDFTLAELREYFIHLGDIGSGANAATYSPTYSKQLGKSFERYREWIKKFCIPGNTGVQNFRNFVTYWMLDMFVSEDEECKVISLVTSDLEDGKIVYIERENKEPYFPGLEDFPIRVNIRSIELKLQNWSVEKSEKVRQSFCSYIKNTNYVINIRNKKIEELF
ncbi:MAG: hypothetical protein NC321_12150 [Clostridium sp.]|nr:hypothetical protein [Clostridium sp.]